MTYKPFFVSIDGQKWKVITVPRAKFLAAWPDADAVTVYDHTKRVREFYFTKTALSKNTVAHEITHAYLSHIVYSDVSKSEFEELFCETVGKNYNRIKHLTEEIYRKIKKLRRISRGEVE